MPAEIQDRNKHSPNDSFLNGFSGNILNILIIKIGSGWVWEILGFCVVEHLFHHLSRTRLGSKVLTVAKRGTGTPDIVKILTCPNIGTST